MFSLVIHITHRINSVYNPNLSILPTTPPSPFICFLHLWLCFCFINKMVYTNSFRFQVYSAVIFDFCFSHFPFLISQQISLDLSLKHIPNRTASFLITSVLVPRPLHVSSELLHISSLLLSALLSLLHPMVPIQPMMTLIKCKWDCHFPPTISRHTE